MADHRGAHPAPVAGCFGCKVLGVGFQGLQSRHGVDPVQRVPVTADDGPRAGRVVGRHDVHWDGVQDARVFAPRLAIETKAREC
jgi:hypothetical protein